MKYMPTHIRGIALMLLLLTNTAFAATAFRLSNVNTTNGILEGFFVLNTTGPTIKVLDYALKAKALDPIADDGSFITLFEWTSNPAYLYPSIASAFHYPSGITDVFFRQSLPLDSDDIVHSVALELAFNEHDFSILTNSIPLIPAPLGNLDQTSNWTELVDDHDYGRFGNVLTGSVVITSVPEPTTLALAGLGIATMGALRRRKLLAKK